MSPSNVNSLEHVVSALTEQQKLALIEQLARDLRRYGKSDAEQKRRALSALRRELAALPTSNPADGLTNRDHDRLLYGGAK